MALLKDVGQESRDGQAVFERVAEALRHAGAIAEGHPLTVSVAGHHDRMEVEPAATRLDDSMAAPQERRVGVDEFRRHDPLAERVLRSVEVGQERVEHAGPLIDAHLEPLPVDLRDHKWDRVEHPGPLLAGGVIVNVVGDAVVADQTPGLLPAVGQLGRLPGAEQIDEPFPVGPGQAVGAGQFVVHAIGGPVARKGIEPALRQPDRRGSGAGGVEERIHAAVDPKASSLKCKPRAAAVRNPRPTKPHNCPGLEPGDGGSRGHPACPCRTAGRTPLSRRLASHGWSRGLPGRSRPARSQSPG